MRLRANFKQQKRSYTYISYTQWYIVALTSTRTYHMYIKKNISESPTHNVHWHYRTFYIGKIAFNTFNNTCELQAWMLNYYTGYIYYGCRNAAKLLGQISSVHCRNKTCTQSWKQQTTNSIFLCIFLQKWVSCCFIAHMWRIPEILSCRVWSHVFIVVLFAWMFTASFLPECSLYSVLPECSLHSFCLKT